MFEKLKLCIEKQTNQQMENEFVYPDKSTAYFDLRMIPIPDGAFILSLNITTKKQLEITLRQSEEKYRNLVENSHDGIVILDKTGKILFANKNEAAMFGTTIEAMLGKSFADFTDPENLPGAMSIYKEFFSAQAKDHYFIVAKGKRADGKIIFVEDIISAVDYNGERAALLIVRDVTERKEQEEALQQRNEALQRANKLMVGRELKMIELKAEIQRLKNLLEK